MFFFWIFYSVASTFHPHLRVAQGSASSGFPQDAVVAALTTKPAPGPTLPVAKGIPVTEATSIAPGTPTAVAIVASPTPSTGAV